MAVKKKVVGAGDGEVLIQPLKQSTITVRIVGTTPMYQNWMAAKAKQQLLVGGQKKSKADRAHIKHQPLQEFRDSAQILPGGPTALGLNVIAVKAAMATAALETTGGLKKASAQRLLYMPGTFAALYGVPQLKMDVVRSADMNRTPDVRTRCYLPQWGAEITMSYIVPQLSMNSVIALLCNAGMVVGVGDFRQEKGKGSFGSFRVLGDEDDAEWNDLVANHGREMQEAALNDPDYADQDTADLMEFFHSEVQRRAA